MRSTRLLRSKRKKRTFKKRFSLALLMICIVSSLFYKFIIKYEFVNNQKVLIENEEIENPDDLEEQGGGEMMFVDNKLSYGNYTIEKSDEPINAINFSYTMNDKSVRPTASLNSEELAKFNSIYIGKDGEKVIYLTFNENTDNSNVQSNLDVLAKHNVKATFFITKKFIDGNSDLVNRMVKEGHLIGITLTDDVDASKLAINNPKEIISSISKTEESLKKVTGKDIDRIFRFPKGIFSKRALNYVNQLGYKSVFWSYTTYDKDDENNKDRSLQLMKSYCHPGAIYSFNGSNIGVAEALDEYLTYMQTQAYVFDLVIKI